MATRHRLCWVRGQYPPIESQKNKASVGSSEWSFANMCLIKASGRDSSENIGINSLRPSSRAIIPMVGSTSNEYWTYPCLNFWIIPPCLNQNLLNRTYCPACIVSVSFLTCFTSLNIFSEVCHWVQNILTSYTGRWQRWRQRLQQRVILQRHPAKFYRAPTSGCLRRTFHSSTRKHCYTQPLALFPIPFYRHSNFTIFCRHYGDLPSILLLMTISPNSSDGLGHKKVRAVFPIEFSILWSGWRESIFVRGHVCIRRFLVHFMVPSFIWYLRFWFVEVTSGLRLFHR